MKRYSIIDNDIFFKDGRRIKYTRISKAAAKKAYLSGDNIALCPVNLRPGSPYNPEIVLNISNNTDGRSFDDILNAFTFYNCNLSEAGRYAAFYAIENI